MNRSASSSSGEVSHGQTTGPRRITHLARLRFLAGHTQASLAAAAGVSQRTVAGLEAEESEPRLSTARAIADALGVELAVAFPFSDIGREGVR